MMNSTEMDVVGGDEWRRKISGFSLGEEVEKKESKVWLSKTIYMYLGFIPMWCSHCNIGELT